MFLNDLYTVCSLTISGYKDSWITGPRATAAYNNCIKKNSVSASKGGKGIPSTGNKENDKCFFKYLRFYFIPGRGLSLMCLESQRRHHQTPSCRIISSWLGDNQPHKLQWTVTQIRYLLDRPHIRLKNRQPVVESHSMTVVQHLCYFCTQLTKVDQCTQSSLNQRASIQIGLAVYGRLI